MPQIPKIGVMLAAAFLATACASTTGDSDISESGSAAVVETRSTPKWFEKELHASVWARLCLDDGEQGIRACTDEVHPHALRWKADLENANSLDCTYPVPDRKATPTRCGWVCDFRYAIACCPRAEGVARTGRGGAPVCGS